MLKGLKTFRQWDIDTRPETRSVPSTKQSRISNIFASIGYTLIMVIADHFCYGNASNVPISATVVFESIAKIKIKRASHARSGGGEVFFRDFFDAIPRTSSPWLHAFILAAWQYGALNWVGMSQLLGSS